jgi:hypothetical protein
MDEQDFLDICAFLQSPENLRDWPAKVRVHQSTSVKVFSNHKRNFRAKCSSFEVVNGTLHYQHKTHGLVRVIKGTEKEAILQACHNSPGDGGHFGINKTTSKIVQRYYWPAMYKDIENHIGKFK